MKRYNIKGTYTILKDFSDNREAIINMFCDSTEDTTQQNMTTEKTSSNLFVES